MAYKHLSIEERAVLAIYIREGCSVRQAAAAIGRSPSTVSRELRRTSKWDGCRGFGYCAFNGVRESEARGKFGGAGKSIRKRDGGVYKRIEFGHWEADTVVSGMGKSRCRFVTLAERKSRLYLVRKIPSREAKYATEAIISMLSPFPRELAKTITCDNGKEFAGWRQIEAALGCQVYFTDAFCAWQKGTNENTNGLLRQFFPKGYNLSRYNQKYIDEKVELLNNRPKKCIGWKTPKEMILEALAKRCT